MKGVGCNCSSLLWTNAQKGGNLCLPQSMNCVGCQFQKHGQLWPELPYWISWVGLAAAVFQLLVLYLQTWQIAREKPSQLQGKETNCPKGLCQYENTDTVSYFHLFFYWVGLEAYMWRKSMQKSSVYVLLQDWIRKAYVRRYDWKLSFSDLNYFVIYCDRWYTIASRCSTQLHCLTTELRLLLPAPELGMMMWAPAGSKNTLSLRAVFYSFSLGLLSWLQYLYMAICSL